MRHLHKESHLVERIGWLSAAVLGANDGIISTASLILVSPRQRPPRATYCLRVSLVSSLAPCPWRRGSMSRSVRNPIPSRPISHERDANFRKIQNSRKRNWPKSMSRGVELELARQVARQLMAKDALGAHARDELGISEISQRGRCRPPSHQLRLFRLERRRRSLLCCFHPNPPVPYRFRGVVAFLALLGLLGARTGGAAILKPIVRVTFWGALAMALTAGIGAIVGTVV